MPGVRSQCKDSSTFNWHLSAAENMGLTSIHAAVSTIGMRRISRRPSHAVCWCGVVATRFKFEPHCVLTRTDEESRISYAER